MSRKKCKDKNWITAGIKKSSENKSRLYKAWIISKNPIAKENYNRYVKIYNNVVKFAELQYYRRTFDAKTNSTKKLWIEINNLCSFGSHLSSNQSKIAKLIHNGNTIMDPNCMADELMN